MRKPLRLGPFCVRGHTKKRDSLGCLVFFILCVLLPASERDAQAQEGDRQER